jgi:AcrR family transcriptional regulator
MATRNGPDTRQRILEAAAALFARRGYHGTSTREIAAEVGIRQPSLFHHFSSKQAILAELLDRDLEPALERIRCFNTSDLDPAARLYAYLLRDVAALTESPFDARGMYNDEVLEDPDLAPQRDKRSALHSETQNLVCAGVDAGVFRDVDPLFAQQIVTGMLLDTIWVTGSDLLEDIEGRPAQVADFVLLGLLRDPKNLEKVRATAIEFVTSTDRE